MFRERRSSGASASRYPEDSSHSSATASCRSWGDLLARVPVVSVVVVHHAPHVLRNVFDAGLKVAGLYGDSAHERTAAGSADLMFAKSNRVVVIGAGSHARVAATCSRHSSPSRSAPPDSCSTSRGAATRSVVASKASECHAHRARTSWMDAMSLWISLDADR